MVPKHIRLMYYYMLKIPYASKDPSCVALHIKYRIRHISEQNICDHKIFNDDDGRNIDIKEFLLEDILNDRL